MSCMSESTCFSFRRRKSCPGFLIDRLAAVRYVLPGVVFVMTPADEDMGSLDKPSPRQSGYSGPVVSKVPDSGSPICYHQARLST